MVFDKREARILVVDDDREFADLLVEHLSSQGYSPAAAYTGREGLIGLRIVDCGLWI